ncbi:MAG: tRNA (adenine(22)-N(1))-methyltransferase TrmK [Tissierellia bacterium]|nr:tRNA (adenine(22)-N(1))-methyltransferase TrmK [Tissierellia bacterium]
MSLSRRLRAIGHLVPPVDTVADVGTDHGLLAEELLLTNKARKVIATDISLPSLKKAEGRLHGLGEDFRGRWEIRLGDGLSVLDEGESQGIILAGMGGLLLKSLLEDAMELVKSQTYILLQPMQGYEALLNYISSQAYEILGLDFVEDGGKYYPLILLTHGGQNTLSWEDFFMFPDFRGYCQLERNRYRQILEEHPAAEGDAMARVRENLKKWEMLYDESGRHC